MSQPPLRFTAIGLDHHHICEQIGRLLELGRFTYTKLTMWQDASPCHGRPRPRLSGTHLADWPVRRSAWVKENTEPARKRALDGGYEGRSRCGSVAGTGAGRLCWLPKGPMFAAFGSLYCSG